MPFLVIGAYIFFSKVKEVFQVTDEAEAEMTATLQENLTGIRVVRAFARQAYSVSLGIFVSRTRSGTGTSLGGSILAMMLALNSGE